ncbi:MAG TPA: extracellular solute-binding protein [Burkholderiales bacterium]|nr:extracellular solute-binding protein [Burkholderiales bacterium]
MAAPAFGAEPGGVVSHAIAMHGEPKYPPGFRHFDYVNPDAPKGGELRLAAEGSYDSFHPFIPRGTAAAGAATMFESLLVGSADEPFTEYGLLAETIEVPRDRSWAVFTLRREARWHDGRPVTVEDVIFSLEALKKDGHPFYRFYYQAIARAEKAGERKVRFTFAAGDNREMPLIAGQLPILAKHYWEGRDFARTTLEPPLGSGPYRVGAFETGRYVVLERVPDYWGRDLPVNRGMHNFERIRYDYFRDATVIREAVKAGSIDLRAENQAKAWALDYDTPAVREGRLLKKAFDHDRTAGMQGFAMNLRRPLFADARVRYALAHAFDFEWSNRNLFFGQYERTGSYFANSELASRGLPGPEELELLEPWRGQIPDEVFTREYRPPSTDGSGWPRENLRRAFELLREAGWVVRDLKLVNEKSGAPFNFEILLVGSGFERIALPYVRNLRRLGIDARVRVVDSSQYINRVRAFDFDMIVAVWGQSASPGNEQRDYWGSAAARSPGSRNYTGIASPAVDALIEALIAARDRESLAHRTGALDRVLLWSHLVVPNWHSPVDRIVFWDKFGYPMPPPRQGTSTDFWWSK